MKEFLAVCLLAVAFAGCVESGDEPGNAAGDGTNVPQDAGLSFNYTINVPTEPVDGMVATVTGTVSQEARVAAQATLSSYSADQYEVVNGSWSIVVPLPEAGLHPLFVEIVAEDGARVLSEHVVNALAESALTIDYGSTSNKETTEDTVWVNMVDYDAQAHYDAEGITHSDYANVHDVLAAWEVQQDHVVDYGYNDGFGSFSVERIDGEGNSLDQGEPPWWCYSVNDEAAGQGISSMRFTPGDRIHWQLGNCGTFGVMP